MDELEFGKIQATMGSHRHTNTVKKIMSEELSRKLDYQFTNPKLFQLALTHRSKSDENNERLEFLGDSIVNFIIAEALYLQFPRAHEGDLSRLRAKLVNRDQLGDLARTFDLGRYLILGPGELKSGGSERLSILSCGMEAVIGAIFLDGGFTVTREKVLKWYAPILSSLTKASSLKDPKTVLQEYLQTRHITLPIYTIHTIEGKVHQQSFIVSCEIEELGKKSMGKGTSRRRAEQHAAEMMLGMIKK